MAGYAGTDPIGSQAWTQWYLNDQPNAGWVQYLRDKSLYGVDPTARYAQNQFNRTYGKYQSEASLDPNLGFYDWLKQTNLDLGGEYGSLAPTTRGDFSDRTVAPRARFMRAY